MAVNADRKDTHRTLARHDQLYGAFDRLRVRVVAVHERHCRPARLDNLSLLMFDPRRNLTTLSMLTLAPDDVTNRTLMKGSTL